ncbi:MAG: hypothetical protein R6X34_11235 [Chloroflexota bacterium]
MKPLEQASNQPIDHKQEQQVYASPAIIYEGTLSTRAGSPITGGAPDGVDPADLFGND